LRRSVLIAGVGGASLGTEIFKSLVQSGKYRILGADISSYAFGLYQKGFARTYLVDHEDYVPSLIKICRKEKVDAIVPGGEEPLKLCNVDRDLIQQESIVLAANSSDVIDLCADKARAFEFLFRKGVPVPKTKSVNSEDELTDFNYPCVIKPSTDSGGSAFVYLAEDREEAAHYLSSLRKKGKKLVVQEYVPHDQGEYTVGVLSLTDGSILGSIALRRLFNSKLSYIFKDQDKVISSGYSQGLIEDFVGVRTQAEEIASKLGSKGPLNVQGRLFNGTYYAFEINPRFSATTYLRTMAGFNEVDMFLQHLFGQQPEPPRAIRFGYYLRSLEENYVAHEKVKS
jgi:carbamoyl-phosphate synthase large subunit